MLLIRIGKRCLENLLFCASPPVSALAQVAQARIRRLLTNAEFCACRSMRYFAQTDQCFPCVVMHVMFSVEPILPFEVVRRMESGDGQTGVAQGAILTIHISGC